MTANEHVQGQRQLSRRSLLTLGGVAGGSFMLGSPMRAAAGTSLIPGPQSSPIASVEHVFSLIGEFSPRGALVSSMVQGGMPVDLALSTSPDLASPVMVGAKPPAADQIYRHNLAGLLTPGTQYFAKLVIGNQMFGRVLSFRTQVDDQTPMHLRIALLSCQCNASSTDGVPAGWNAVAEYSPDLLLHGGDFGYWGGTLTPTDPYPVHMARYAKQMTGIPTMRDVLEATSSLIQVSDHETSDNNGDNFNDAVTANALDAYFRMMPYQVFNDHTRHSRFLTRKLGTNVRLVVPDFRSLDRSPGKLPDNGDKTAWGVNQFNLFVAAMRQPEALKIILSDPGASPADAPPSPDYLPTLDKWCNYQTAYQAFADVIRDQRTIDGKPIRADIWSGDRHLLGALAEDHNPWGPFDVLTSSGIDQHSLPLESGELYDQVFGDDIDKTRHVKQHMEIELYDDKAGTIRRVAHGIDDITGDEVVTSEKQWTY